MKPETDPIAEDEWLIRLVWHDRFTDRTPIISPNSFEPRTKGHHPDVDGISLFRRDCLNDPTDALLAIPEDKRSQYGIVQIPVILLADLKLSVKPSPIETVRGHVVVPEMSASAYSANKTQLKPVMLRLAEVASENIMRRPTQQESG